MRWIIDMFWSPSGFDDDLRGYAANQLGHFVLGFFAGLFLGSWALIGWAAWEVAQWRYAGGDPSDCAEDFGFESAGVLAVIFPALIIPALAYLVSGMFRRF